MLPLLTGRELGATLTSDDASAWSEDDGRNTGEVEAMLPSALLLLWPWYSAAALSRPFPYRCSATAEAEMLSGVMGRLRGSVANELGRDGGLEDGVPTPENDVVERECSAGAIDAVGSSPSGGGRQTS